MNQSLNDLQNAGTIPPTVADTLVSHLRNGQHLLITGLPGSGKTTLLRALATAVIQPHHQLIQLEPLSEFGRYRVRGQQDNAPPDYGIADDVQPSTVLAWLNLSETRHCTMIAAMTSRGPATLIDDVAELVRARIGYAPRVKVTRQVAAATDVVVHMVRDPNGRTKVAWVVGEFTRQGTFKTLWAQKSHRNVVLAPQQTG